MDESDAGIWLGLDFLGVVLREFLQLALHSIKEMGKSLLVFVGRVGSADERRDHFC